MKKLFLKTTFTLTLFLCVFNIAYALNDYAVLTPLPGTTLPNNKTTNFETYLPGAFRLAIGVAAAMAFVMISFGGFTYMTADAAFKKDEGRKYVENAIYGLLLVIGAWVILNTINPQILNFKLVIPKPNITFGDGPSVTGGTPMTEDDVIESNRVRNELSPVIVYAGPCIDGRTSGCVNLNGLTSNTVSGLRNLKAACGCSITVTGGTEGEHTAGSSHNNGTAVDLRPDSGLNTFLGKPTPRAGDSVTKTINGKSVTFTYEVLGTGGISTGNHWHGTF